ncbi:MAG: PIN domain-containing protein [Cyanobacteria bacterium P01_A01_bin.40]
MGSNFTAIYDACVLYPAPLRDLLMQLALSDLYRARWTEKIHSEWMRNVLKNRPDLSKKQLARTKNLMDRSVRDCLIEGYEYIIPSLELPDPDDRHILAAAIKGQADIIVTMNLKDFPNSILSEYEIEAQHPDIFIADLIDIYPMRVATAAEACRKRLKNPPKSIDEYLEILLKQGLTVTTSLLKQYCYEV